MAKKYTAAQAVDRIGKLEAEIAETVAEIDKLRKALKSEMLEGQIEQVEGRQYQALIWSTLTDVINPVSAILRMTEAEIKKYVTVSTKVKDIFTEQDYRRVVTGQAQKFSLKIKEV